MLTVLVTTDLMFSSTLQGAALQAGSEFQCTSPVRLDALMEETQPDVMLIDLAAAGLELESLVPQLREKLPEMQLVAYGPHVHEQRLEQARLLGCDKVLTRGQIHHTGVELLKEYRLAAS